MVCFKIPTVAVVVLSCLLTSTSATPPKYSCPPDPTITTTLPNGAVVTTPRPRICNPVYTRIDAIDPATSCQYTWPTTCARPACITLATYTVPCPTDNGVGYGVGGHGHRCCEHAATPSTSTVYNDCPTGTECPGGCGGTEWAVVQPTRCYGYQRY